MGRHARRATRWAAAAALTAGLVAASAHGGSRARAQEAPPVTEPPTTAHDRGAPGHHDPAAGDAAHHDRRPCPHDDRPRGGRARPRRPARHHRHDRRRPAPRARRPQPASPSPSTSPPAPWSSTASRSASRSPACRTWTTSCCASAWTGPSRPSSAASTRTRPTRSSTTPSTPPCALDAVLPVGGFDGVPARRGGLPRRPVLGPGRVPTTDGPVATVSAALPFDPDGASGPTADGVGGAGRAVRPRAVGDGAGRRPRVGPRTPR